MNKLVVVQTGFFQCTGKALRSYHRRQEVRLKKALQSTFEGKAVEVSSIVSISGQQNIETFMKNMLEFIFPGHTVDISLSFKKKAMDPDFVVTIYNLEHKLELPSFVPRPADGGLESVKPAMHANEIWFVDGSNRQCTRIIRA